MCTAAQVGLLLSPHFAPTGVSCRINFTTTLLLKVNFQYSDGHQWTHLIMAILCPLFQMATPLYSAQNYSGWPHFLGGADGVYFQYGNALSTVALFLFLRLLMRITKPEFTVMKNYSAVPNSICCTLPFWCNISGSCLSVFDWYWRDIFRYYAFVFSVHEWGQISSLEAVLLLINTWW